MRYIFLSEISISLEVDYLFPSLDYSSFCLYIFTCLPRSAFHFFHISYAKLDTFSSDGHLLFLFRHIFCFCFWCSQCEPCVFEKHFVLWFFWLSQSGRKIRFWCCRVCLCVCVTPPVESSSKVKSNCLCEYCCCIRSRKHLLTNLHMFAAVNLIKSCMPNEFACVQLWSSGRTNSH